MDECVVKVVQSMYSNARCRVRVSDSHGDEFSVNVGAHQGSVLSAANEVQNRLSIGVIVCG